MEINLTTFFAITEKEQLDHESRAKEEIIN